MHNTDNMNGNNKNPTVEVELEENEEMVERQSLTGSPNNRGVSQQRFCCFRFRFWSVQRAGDDVLDGFECTDNEKEVHVRVVVQTLQLVAMSLFALMVILAMSKYFTKFKIS